MEDYNNIIIEDDIVKDISFIEGIYGTTYVLVDVDNLYYACRWSLVRVIM